ncbi:unnamed protein product [Brassica napus]|uniref:(rape) hypothetical protein n=1 Tax=Brassica napus TaxID=3708 RepID=A0A816IX35_BRANA|nr:unnamed protein product [Brassica napus]
MGLMVCNQYGIKRGSGLGCEMGQIGCEDEGTRDGFNIPAYMRSPEEVAAGVDRIGGFKIEKMEYRKLVEYSDEKHED